MAEYVFSGSPEQLLDAFKLLRLRAAQEQGKGTPFWLVPNDGSYRAQLGPTIILWTAQADGTSYVYVPDNPAVAEAWAPVRDFLLQRGYKVDQIDPAFYTTVQHPYIDPSQVRAGRQRDLLILLIDQHLGRHNMSNEEMWTAVGYDRSSFFRLKSEFTREENDAQS